jgi:ABC-type Co2+ transport system permease subunit
MRFEIAIALGLSMGCTAGIAVAAMMGFPLLPGSLIGGAISVVMVEFLRRMYQRLRG